MIKVPDRARYPPVQLCCWMKPRVRKRGKQIMVSTTASLRVAAASCALLGMALTGCQGAKPPVMAEKGPLIQSAFACADFNQTIYFEAGQSAVTRPAERLLTLAAERSRRCTMTGVAIVGLADAPGDSASNLALSERRADAVKAALHRHGFDKVEITTAAAGDSGAQTVTGQAKPVRRRAVVTFHLAPRAAM